MKKCVLKDHQEQVLLRVVYDYLSSKSSQSPIDQIKNSLPSLYSDCVGSKWFVDLFRHTRNHVSNIHYKMVTLHSILRHVIGLNASGDGHRKYEFRKSYFASLSKPNQMDILFEQPFEVRLSKKLESCMSNPKLLSGFARDNRELFEDYVINQL